MFFVTEDWYFCSHRLALAVAAKEAGNTVLVVTRVRRHGHLIREAGLKLVPFGMRRHGTNPLIEILTIIKLVFVYIRYKPDCLHHVAVKPVVYGSIASLARPRCHVVNALTGMGWLFTDKNGGLLRSLVARVFAALLNRGRVIVQNRDDADFLQRIGIDKNNIHLVRGSGVDVSRFSAQHEREADKILVVLPARLLWDKGVGEFVEAARIIRKKRNDVKFALVGSPDEGNPSSVTEDDIKEWVTEGVVEWWGWQEDMVNVFSQCHIVCLPSYYREGIPKALIEAAACGRPIVTTDTIGCREVVDHGVNGLLVPPRDSKALAAAIDELVADPVRRIEMGKKGRKKAVSEFSIEKVVAETLEVYRELCG